MRVLGESMVGIVIVAHSQKLAEGLCELAGQMSARQNLPIAAAGGLEDGSLGTSLERIARALDRVYSDHGVLILMDLGSAVMTAQMLLEMLPAERQARIRLSNAPLVEGAIAAAVAAAQGEDLAGVQRAAEEVMRYPKLPPEGEPPAEPLGPAAGVASAIELIVPNPIGLHARPASAFVQLAARYRARITVQNVSQGRPAADAKSMLQVASRAAARQGERIRIVAEGEDAEAALEALADLVAEGFGELAAPPPAVRREPPAEEVPLGPAPRRLRGIGAAEGVALAPAYLFAARAAPVLRHAVSDPQAEVQRLQRALDEAQRQLRALEAQVARTDPEAARIFGFQRLMLEDDELAGAIAQRIRATGVNAEAAAADLLAEWTARFEGLDDEVMRARAVDVRDVGERLLGALQGSAVAPARLPGPAIVVAEDLTPSAAALLDRALVRGMATAAGGSTSHTAILARLWGIPAVVGLGPGILAVAPGTLLALDGGAGLLEVDPTAEVAQAYRERGERLAAGRVEALAQAGEPALTRDGRQVEVVANIGDVASVEEALRYGAEGVGLLRSEFLYLDRDAPPDEEEQYLAYRAIATALGRRPLVVRTLDAGGDKELPYLEPGREQNPFLGVRGLRLCLERPELFQPQLRAILRAAVGHDVRLMFPMVATQDEVRRAREALAEARRALAAAGRAFAGQVQVGIMVETPAAAVGADLLAPHVDFLSIGSNDLTQYVLACDRTNERLRDLYRPLEPAVLRLVRAVIEAGHAAGRWVGLCGELAGEPLAIPILLGLGLDEFSMAAPAIPAAKALIRRLDGREARRVALEAVAMGGAAEVEAHMARFLAGLGGG